MVAREHSDVTSIIAYVQKVDFPVTKPGKQGYHEIALPQEKILLGMEVCLNRPLIIFLPPPIFKGGLFSLLEGLLAEGHQSCQNQLPVAAAST